MRIARQLGPGHTIVTVLCDGGQRHLTKLYNLDFLQKWGLTPDIDRALLSDYARSNIDEDSDGQDAGL